MMITVAIRMKITNGIFKSILFLVLMVLLTNYEKTWADDSLTYGITQEKEHSIYYLVIKNKLSGFKITTHTEQDNKPVYNEEHELDSEFAQVSWFYQSSPKNSDIHAIRFDDTIRVHGTYNGKTCNLYFPCNGLPWYQITPISLRASLYKQKVTSFITLGGFKELGMYRMTVISSESDHCMIGGLSTKTIHAKIGLDKIPSWFWHADYWFRSSDYRLLCLRMKMNLASPVQTTELTSENGTAIKIQLN